MQIKGFFLLLLSVSTQWVFAAPWDARFKERDDSIALSLTITSELPSISSSAQDPEGSNESAIVTSTTARSQSTSLSMTRSASSSAILTSTSPVSSTSGSATSIYVTDSASSSTITPGQLPLQPKITPGFAIAGVILVATGALYTLIGIKNKWLHISLSAGYLVSVAITVLILYVLDLPVSNAVQGAYVVAVVLPGLIIGGCSLMFSEMTEGLGCLLGGFCFSMWLLVMKAGGLITSTLGKSIFIAAVSIAAFSLSFSHYTRSYGLIASISFAGSTAIVLGIDCFSRAGLKEFWAYIWNLNQNLFPLGATTYPVTRGIRVEIAAIFIIFLAGLMSQSKVHKIIQDHRAQKLAERQENARALEEEEMNVGRRIEDQNVTEKQRWEEIYGDKIKSGDDSITRDSGVCDMESSKRGPVSIVTSIGELDGKEIEMSDMSSPTRSNETGHLMPNETEKSGAITVRVVQDIEPEFEENEKENSVLSHQLIQGSQTITSTAEEEVWAVSTNGEVHQASRPSQKLSKEIPTLAITTTPKVVPLPFKILKNEQEDNRSSIATFADEELAVNNKSLGRMSSDDSASLKRPSARSERESQRYSKEPDISTEDLLIPYADEDDRASSIAATVDDLSENEDMDTMETRSIGSSFVGQDSTTPDANDFEEESHQSEPGVVSPSPAAAESHIDSSEQITSSSPMDKTSEDSQNKCASGTSGNRQSSELRPELGITVTPDILNTSGNETFPKEPVPQQHSLITIGHPTSNGIECVSGEDLEDNENRTESNSKAEPSATSAFDIKTTTLTKDQLPSQLSRVVMSYRTNEWAKHLGHADPPQLEDLHISNNATEDPKSESAVPVDVEALQQTAHNALSPPAPRSSSQQSNQSPGLTRSSSTQSNITPFATIPEGSSVHEHDVLIRNSSQQSLRGLAMHRSLRNSSNPNIPKLIVESPRKETPPSQRHSSRSISPAFGSSNTLIGKRDTILRNRSSYFPVSNPSSHANPTLESHQFSASQFQSATASQIGSQTGPIRGELLSRHVSTPSPMFAEDVYGDDIPLSHRRELIRQSTQQPLSQPPTNFNSHQPKRQSGIANPMVREQQLANWRASVAHDLQMQKQREIEGVERQRSVLWQERMGEEGRREVERRRREEREEMWNEKIRVGGKGMEELHRRVLGKMQNEARKGV